MTEQDSVWAVGRNDYEQSIGGIYTNKEDAQAHADRDKDANYDIWELPLNFFSRDKRKLWYASIKDDNIQNITEETWIDKRTLDMERKGFPYFYSGNASWDTRQFVYLRANTEEEAREIINETIKSPH